MRARAIVVAAVVTTMLCFGAAASSAKDICVQDDAGGVFWVFAKVKALKPGKVVALNGIYGPGGIGAPITGTAFMTTGGAVHIGVFVHSMAPFSGLNITVNETTDATFTGTGNYENSGDSTADGTITWTNVDCSTVPAP